MEVHKHPHHVMHSKKWHEYLLEFLMLFLAVFLGFVAENIREDQSDKGKEKQYMQSIIKDLETDTTNLKNIIKRKSDDIVRTDSLLKLLTGENFQNATGLIYYYGRMISLTDFFHITNGTVQQLINSGSLRLIKKQDIIDSIQSYMNTYADLSFRQNLEEEHIFQYRDVASKIFDVKVFEAIVRDTSSNMMSDTASISKPVGNPSLLTNDKLFLNEMLMKVHYMKRNKIYNKRNLQLLNIKAKELIQLIKNEYNV